MDKKVIIPLLAVFALASCKKDEPMAQSQPEPAAQEQPGPAATPAAPTSSWDTSNPVAGTTLAIAPNPVDLCTEKQAVVEVSWDVSAAAPKYVQLWINDNGKETLWASVKDQIGKKQTGKWAKAGLEFVVIDPVTKKAINSAKVESTPCQ